jgi:hypothetical protein
MSKARKSLLIVAVIALISGVGSLSLKLSSTNAQKKAATSTQNTNNQTRIRNYDIRVDKNAADKIERYRARARRAPEIVEAIRDRQASGVETLKQRVPSLTVDVSESMQIPEVIAPDVRDGKDFLTGPSSVKRPDALRAFIANNSNLVGIDPAEASGLKTVADYSDPDGKLSFVELKQEVDGVPVFQGRVKAGFTKSGELVRVINSLAPGVSGAEVADDFGDPIAAATAAAGYVNLDAASMHLAVDPSASTDQKQVLGRGALPPTAEKMYFPTEAGVVIPAWRVLLKNNGRVYYVVVDAIEGSLLWSKCLTDDQTQPATYNVYANPNAMINVATSPFPFGFANSSPNASQSAAITRTLISRIGNEAPYTFNTNGWIPDGGTDTNGNAVEAGLDRDTVDGVDTVNGRAVAANRVFDFPASPLNPNTNAGDSPEAIDFTLPPTAVDPATEKFTKTAHGLANGAIIRFSSTGTLPTPLTTDKDYFVTGATADDFSIATTKAGTAVDITAQGTGTYTIYWSPVQCFNAGATPQMTDYQRAVVTQLFYIANWYHDETYRLGFTESAHNFQENNFGRGGVGGDRVSAEAQDCSGTNNANFTTPADGARGQMQMYVFTGPNPDSDGALDAQVVVHESTHGLSNRLHGNTDGLFYDMARGMGEGWSDFYSLAMLSQPSDPVQGIYPEGPYASYRLGGTFTNNSYYGIRRFPYAVKSFVGANGKPHDPLTFADIDNSKINLTDGAFAPSGGGLADEVHNIGEVWCTMLWEVRGQILSRPGMDSATGNRKALQLVTDGMKLAPIDPTFLQERDAILAAAMAGGDPKDVADVWSGFAARGLGASATIENAGGLNFGNGSGTIRVTEAFDLPNLSQARTLTVSDAPGDGDGYAEPGEHINITVPITNVTGQNVTGVTVTITGGGTTVYGSLTGIQTTSQTIAYTVPANATCGAAMPITIGVSSSLGTVTFQRQIFVGKPATTAPSENFDAVTAPALPSGWAATSVNSGTNFLSTSTTPDSGANAMFALDPTTVGGGTDLNSALVSVTSASATLTFRQKYNTEQNWDGGVVEISVNGSPFQDITAAGGSFTQGAYNTFVHSSAVNPLGARSAWSGTSAGYVTTIIQLPAAANGQMVQFKWRFGADNNTAAATSPSGWWIDSISFSGAAFVTSFSCQAGVVTGNSAALNGRVVNAGGFGIRDARVTMLDSANHVRVTLSNAFGYYSFGSVTTGQNITLKAVSRGYTFAPVTVSVTPSLAPVNLVASP